MNKKILAFIAAGFFLVLVWPGQPVESQSLVDVSPENRMLLSSLTSLADAHIRSALDALQILSGTREVRSLRWETMKGLLGEAQRRGIPGAVWFARPDGSYFTVDRNSIDQNLKDRGYFPRVLAGETVVGSLVVSRSTGKKSAVLAVPVLKKGKTVGVLGWSIALEAFSELLTKEIGLAENRVFFALDSTGQTVLHVKTEKVFADAAKQDSPSLANVVSEMAARGEGQAEYEYQQSVRRILYKTSPLTHWRFAYGTVQPF
ncbi:MAG TPA: cache domain-containing protein [bacterium]